MRHVHVADRNSIGERTRSSRMACPALLPMLDDAVGPCVVWWSTRLRWLDPLR